MEKNNSELKTSQPEEWEKYVVPSFIVLSFLVLGYFIVFGELPPKWSSGAGYYLVLGVEVILGICTLFIITFIATINRAASFLLYTSIFYAIYYFFLKDASINAILSILIFSIFYIVYGVQEYLSKKNENNKLENENNMREFKKQLDEISSHLYMIEKNTDKPADYSHQYD